MKAFSIHYFENRDEIEVRFTNELRQSTRITQLDILKDAICELQNYYGAMLIDNKLEKEHE